MHYCMEFLVLRQSWIALLILKLSARNCLGNIPFVLFYFWFPSFSTFGAVTALHYSLTSLIIFVIISDLIGRIESFLNVSLYTYISTHWKHFHRFKLFNLYCQNSKEMRLLTLIISLKLFEVIWDSSRKLANFRFQLNFLDRKKENDTICPLLQILGGLTVIAKSARSIEDFSFIWIRMSISTLMRFHIQGEAA